MHATAAFHSLARAPSHVTNPTKTISRSEPGASWPGAIAVSVRAGAALLSLVPVPGLSRSVAWTGGALVTQAHGPGVRCGTEYAIGCFTMKRPLAGTQLMYTITMSGCWPAMILLAEPDMTWLWRICRGTHMERASNDRTRIAKTQAQADRRDVHERFARLRRLAEPHYRHRLMLICGVIAVIIVSVLAAVVSLQPVLPLDVLITRE